MPKLTATLQPGPLAAETIMQIRALHRELLNLGFSINEFDLTQPKYSAAAAGELTTGDAVISFKKRFEFPVVGQGDSCEIQLGLVVLVMSQAMDGSGSDLLAGLEKLSTAASQLPTYCAARLARVAYAYRQLTAAQKFAARAGTSQPRFNDWKAFADLLSAPGREKSKIEYLMPENYLSYRREPFGSRTDSIVAELSRSV